MALVDRGLIDQALADARRLTDQEPADPAAWRALGFRRTEAARFALLLSIPAILASGGGILLDIEGSAASLFSSDALIAAGLSAVDAFFAIAFMMALLRRVGMTPFVIYRLVLGAVLLWYAYS